MSYLRSRGIFSRGSRGTLIAISILIPLLIGMIDLGHWPFPMAEDVKGSESLPAFFDLQSRIDSTDEGETLHLGPGYFIGNVTIDKRINLTGDGPGSTIISGTCNGTILEVLSPLCIIEDITISGNLTSIEHHEGYRSWLEEYRDEIGIRVDASHSIIRNVEITGSLETGLSFSEKGEWSAIEGCRIDVQGTLLEVDNAEGFSAIDSFFDCSNAAIHISGSNGSKLIGNRFDGTGEYNEMMTHFQESDHILLENNTVNSTQIYLESCGNATLYNNRFQGWRSGPSFQDCNDLIFRKNEVKDTRWWVDLGSEGSTITQNRFIRSGIGAGGDGNDISHNDFSGERSGVGITRSNGNRVIENVFRDGTIPIHISAGDGNLVQDNILSGCTDVGIDILPGFGNSVRGNIIDGAPTGIRIATELMGDEEALTNSPNYLFSNRITSSEIGVYMRYSGQVWMENNELLGGGIVTSATFYLNLGQDYFDSSNTVNGEQVFIVVDKKDFRVSGDPYQLIMHFCENTTVEDMAFHDIPSGLIIDLCLNMTIRNITATDVRTGLELTNSDHCLIENCRFSGYSPENGEPGGIGIEMLGADHNLFRNCIIGPNFGFSVFSFTSEHVDFIECTFRNNTEAGARFYSSYLNRDSNNITFTDCIITGNRYHGIQFWNVWDCRITGGTFDDNSDADIALFGECPNFEVVGVECNLEKKYARPIDDPMEWDTPPKEDDEEGHPNPSWLSSLFVLGLVAIITSILILMTVGIVLAIISWKRHRPETDCVQ